MLAKRGEFRSVVRLDPTDEPNMMAVYLVDRELIFFISTTSSHKLDVISLDIGGDNTNKYLLELILQ